MTILNIVIRTLSGYTGEEIILGVFRDLQDALINKENYINYLKQDGDSYEQCQYIETNLKDAIYVQTVNGDVSEGCENVYCLISHCEAFGQVCRAVKYISDDYNKIKTKAQELYVKELREKEPFPSEWVSVKLDLDVICLENNDELVEFT